MDNNHDSPKGRTAEEIKRKYFGDIDEVLQYKRGSPIHLQYMTYKEADEVVETAIAAYKAAARAGTMS